MGASVFLGYQSALEYLCRERYFEASPLGGFHLGSRPVTPAVRTARVRALGGSCPGDDDIRSLLDGPLRGLSTPVHVLVPNSSVYSRSKIKIPHVWSNAPINGSFVKITTDLSTCSAELCLVQFARLFSPIELARLSYELCGTYALAPDRNDGFRSCEPSTQVELARSFARRAKAAGIRGATALLAALDHVVDGAASPMESAITLLLCLPYRYGGYHLPLPALNQTPRNTGGKKSIADAVTHRCDLLWPDAGVSFEYESDDWHKGILSAVKDTTRNNTMAAKRHLVFAATKELLYDEHKFGLIARQIACALGKRLHMDDCRYNWRMRRFLLRQKLLPGKNNPHCDERAGRNGAWVPDPNRRSQN